MSFSQSIGAPRRVVALLAILCCACAASGSSDDRAVSPDTAGVDCSELAACGEQLQCSGTEQCFKLKSCPRFVCVQTKLACRSECGPSADCLVLESYPMMLSCR